MLARWGNMGRGDLQPTRQITRHNVIVPNATYLSPSRSLQLLPSFCKSAGLDFVRNLLLPHRTVLLTAACRLMLELGIV